MPTGILLSPKELHIPDGFLSTPVALAGWLLTIIAIALALRNTRDQLGERQVPLMGVLAAAVFAGQMLNFAIPGGTSGHLLGGAGHARPWRHDQHARKQQPSQEERDKSLHDDPSTGSVQSPTSTEG